MEDPIFYPLQLGKPLTDFDKIWKRWLCRRRDPQAKFVFCTFSGGTSPYRWNCHPRCLFFYLFFTFWRSCSPAQIASFVEETSLMAHKTCFCEF